MSNKTWKINPWQFRIIVLGNILMILSWSAALYASELKIGTATIDISPKLPVALAGQFYMRIAKTAATPLSASALALESVEGGQSRDLAIMVSCDLISIPTELLVMVREEVHRLLPELDINKIFLNGTHTHTAPVLQNGQYPIPKDSVIQVDAYRAFFVKTVAEGISGAWKSREPGSVSWGLSHAAVANNRRAVYADGSAQMYGKTNVPEFRNLEGFEDHDVNSLFFWNQYGKLVAMSVEVPCTAQEVENDYSVNADYWYPVRTKLRQIYGSDLCILGWIGAAGDQSPHLMYRKAAEDRMRELRKLSRLDEIARRVVIAVNETYDAVKNDRHPDVPFIHRTEKLILPMRLVTEAEYTDAKVESDKLAARITADPKLKDEIERRMKWYKATLDRFEKQKTDPHPVYETEIHVLRLGDVAICPNQFEFFTDFGLRIQARSKAVQTIIIQCAGSGTYLPTDKAVRGGGYSAVVQSSIVGPEGGQMLVERTVELINSLWPETK